MDHVNEMALAIVVASFLVVTVIGFAAARWRPAENPRNLNEWGLGGRGFGTFVSWFLLGGDLYTAYTFIAVPALVYAVGAAGFYALSVHGPGLPDRVRVRAAAVVGRPRTWLRHRRPSSPGAGTARRGWGSR